MGIIREDRASSAPRYTVELAGGAGIVNVGHESLRCRTVVPGQDDSIDVKQAAAELQGQREGQGGKQDEGHGAEQEQDEYCYVCRGGESVQGNLILFCDGKCNGAAHQKCIDVEEIPEGDWFCPRCRGGK